MFDGIFKRKSKQIVLENYDLVCEFQNDFLNKKKELDSVKDHWYSEFQESCLTAIDEYKAKGVRAGIYACIADQNVVEWLSETGYGVKIANKLASLIKVDDYGDTDFEDADRELGRFVEKRLDRIVHEVNLKIPKKYIQISRLDDEKWALKIGGCVISDDPDFPTDRDELKQEVRSHLWDKVFYFCE